MRSISMTKPLLLTLLITAGLLLMATVAFGQPATNEDIFTLKEYQDENDHAFYRVAITTGRAITQVTAVIQASEVISDLYTGPIVIETVSRTITTTVMPISNSLTVTGSWPIGTPITVSMELFYAPWEYSTVFSVNFIVSTSGSTGQQFWHRWWDSPFWEGDGFEPTPITPTSAPNAIYLPLIARSPITAEQGAR